MSSNTRGVVKFIFIWCAFFLRGSCYSSLKTLSSEEQKWEVVPEEAQS